MILLHAAMDISLSFLSVVMLLCILFAAGHHGEPVRNRAASIRILFLLPLLLLGVLSAGAIARNRAAYAAREGDFEGAISILERGAAFPGPEESIWRMTWALESEQYGRVDHIFRSMEEPNATAYYMRAVSLVRRERHEEAAAAAIDCIRLSPHQADGYALLASITSQLQPDIGAQRETEAAQLRRTAEKSQHPLFTYIEQQGKE